MKKILFMVLILLFLTACSTETVRKGEYGETITQKSSVTTETITIENDYGVNRIALDKVAKTAVMETNLKINDTTESTQGTDMAPFVFNLMCLGMAQMFNETAQLEGNELIDALKGFELKKIVFEMSDFEDGDLIGRCTITGIEKIDCKAYRSYNNPMMGMEMCDFTFKSLEEGLGVG